MMNTRLLTPGSYNLDVTIFSTARTTPSLQMTPTQVPLASTALLAYSTWKMRPSGENCAADKSY